MLSKTAVGHLPFFRLSDILLFDNIYLHSLDSNIEAGKKSGHPLANTMERLRSEEIIKEIPTEGYDKRIEAQYPIEPNIGSDSDADYIANYLIDFVVDKTLRLWEMTVQTRGDFCVLLVDEHALLNPLSKTAKSVKVLDFTFRGLTQPNWNASAEKLIELRSDSKEQEYLRSIYSVIKTIAMTGLAPLRRAPSAASPPALTRTASAAVGKRYLPPALQMSSSTAETASFLPNLPTLLCPSMTPRDTSNAKSPVRPCCENARAATAARHSSRELRFMLPVRCSSISDFSSWCE